MKPYLVVVKNEVDCTHYQTDYETEGKARLAFKGFIGRIIDELDQFSSVELLVYNPDTFCYHLIAVFDYFY